MNRALEARKALALTQEQFAATLGVHAVTISRYERGAEPIPRAKQALFHLIVHATDRQRDQFLERFYP